MPKDARRTVTPLEAMSQLYIGHWPTCTVKASFARLGNASGYAGNSKL
jgi:hypothetical protein